MSVNLSWVSPKIRRIAEDAFDAGLAALVADLGVSMANGNVDLRNLPVQPYILTAVVAALHVVIKALNPSTPYGVVGTLVPKAAPPAPAATAEPAVTKVSGADPVPPVGSAQ